jgi:hypothetical protein
LLVMVAVTDKSIIAIVVVVLWFHYEQVILQRRDWPDPGDSLTAPTPACI